MGLISRVSSRTWGKMVTFTCGNCGESLKKSKVEQHYYRCRMDYVTCIDCNKDFYGDDYKNHNSCVSEAQRYGGANFQAKANKGEVKQNSWIESIQGAMNNASLSPNAKRVLDVIGCNENIPRKKKKFDNFVKNTCRFAKENVINEIWDAINVKKPEPQKLETKRLETKKPESKESDSYDEKPFFGGADFKDPKISAKVESAEINNNKRKMDNSPANTDKKIKIDWKWSREIKEMLRSVENSSCKVKSLRKKVFKKAEENGVDLIEKEEFLEKIKKVKKIKLDEEKGTVSI